MEEVQETTATLPIKKKTSVESTFKIASGPTLVMATKLMKAADKYGMKVRGFLNHHDLMLKEGLFPNKVTESIVNEAEHLTRVWDHKIQEKVLALGGIMQ